MTKLFAQLHFIRIQLVAMIGLTFGLCLQGRAGTDTLIGPRAMMQQGFAWGVNGHPLNQEAYWDNLDDQMEILKAAGLSYYRIDMANNDEGIPDSMATRRFFRLQELAERNHITLVPIIFPPEARLLYALDSAQAYAKGVAIGKGFAMRFASYFQFCELGNENDIDIMKQPAGDGSDSAHYDMGRLSIMASMLKGMSEGLRLGGAHCSIIISNAGWMHYAYFRLLEQEGVHFDIIGYHWYEDPSHLKEVLYALDLYFPGKPVWFTEVNARDIGDGYSYRYQQKRVIKYINIIRRLGRNITGFFLYELFDQPAVPGVRERRYGLVSWTKPYKRFLYKPLAVWFGAKPESSRQKN